MAFQAGKSSIVLFNQFDVSAYFNDFTINWTKDLADTTTYGNTAHTFMPILHNGTLSLSGLFDSTATSGPDVNLAATLAATDPTEITVALEGSMTIGKRVATASNFTSSYEISAPVAEVVSTSAEFQSTAGIGVGWSLHSNAAAEGTTGAAVNSTSVDTGAQFATPTTGGAIALLHVTATTAATTTVKVQHSSDNVTFADLITFTASTAASSQTGVVAVGTSINRYIRVTQTGTAAANITFAVSFVRL